MCVLHAGHLVTIYIGVSTCATGLGHKLRLVKRGPAPLILPQISSPFAPVPVLKGKLKVVPNTKKSGIELLQNASEHCERPPFTLCYEEEQLQLI